MSIGIIDVAFSLQV